jgi:hypothetical protein
LESIARSYIFARILSASGMKPENQAIQTLTRQGYHLVGSGAVKPCLWLRRAMLGGDQFYKHHFYGISSHRCVQMTPTLHLTKPFTSPGMLHAPFSRKAKWGAHSTSSVGFSGPLLKVDLDTATTCKGY